MEGESSEQLRQAIAAGAKRILLENFDLAGLRGAVKVTAGPARLEAFGGINLETVQAVAQTGVDRISIGSLTKKLRAVDPSVPFAGTQSCLLATQSISALNPQRQRTSS